MNERDAEQVFYALGSLLQSYIENGYDIIAVSTVDFDFTSSDPNQVNITIAIPLTEMVASPMVSLEGFDEDVREDGTLPVTFTATLRPEKLDTDAEQSKKKAEQSLYSDVTTVSDPLTSQNTVEIESEETDSVTSVGEFSERESRKVKETPSEGKRQQTRTEPKADPSPKTHHEGGSDATKELPAYKDPEKLRAVYDEEDTFAEMTESLGVDVTPQTVRRHMVKLGIHEPESRLSNTISKYAKEADTSPLDLDPEERENRRSGSGGDSESNRQMDTQPKSEQQDADRSELRVKKQTETELSNEEVSAQERGEEERDDDPEGAESESVTPQDRSEDLSDYLVTDVVDEIDDEISLTIGDISSVVQDARTMYEVEQQIDVKRETLRKTLKQLGLLEIVSGRLTNGSENSVSQPQSQDHINTIIKRHLSE